jgi:hypothetical protein
VLGGHVEGILAAVTGTYKPGFDGLQRGCAMLGWKKPVAHGVQEVTVPPGEK